MHWNFENMRPTSLFAFVCLWEGLNSEWAYIARCRTRSIFFSFILLLWLLHCSCCLACLCCWSVWVGSKCTGLCEDLPGKRNLENDKEMRWCDCRRFPCLVNARFTKFTEKCNRSFEFLQWVMSLLTASLHFAVLSKMTHVVELVECMYEKSRRYRTRDPSVETPDTGMMLPVIFVWMHSIFIHSSHACRLVSTPASLGAGPVAHDEIW